MQPEQKVNLLLVDDQPENLLALEAILDKLGQNLVRATSGKDALRCLLNQDFAVILLDVQMPDMDGFETATLIRQRPRSRYTPIIFLTAFSTSDTFVFKGYSLGAVDYLFKPIETEILTSKVTVFVDLFKKTAEVKRQAAELATANAELRQSEERFRSLSACSPVGIFLTDVEGRYTYTNPCYQTICGFTDDVETPQATPSHGESWLQLVHAGDREQVLAGWSAQTLKGHEYSNEFRIIQIDSPDVVKETVRWVHLQASPMRSAQGELIGYVGTLADITERKQAEEARVQFIREQEARRQAEAANRMKDEFLATLSHELRTPLNSILGWATMLRTRSFDQAAAARALETIERNAKLQAQLIEDILDVSRIIQGKLHLSFHSVNLVPVIQTAVDTIRPAVEAKAIQLVVTLDPAPEDVKSEEGGERSKAHPSHFLVPGDPVRLQQIVWNLLSNAIKFTPKGGRVELRLSIVDSHAQIKVSDTGIGIDKKILPFIFDRFRQADSTTTRSYGGLGLGLAIVRHLVALHEGTVDVESDGEGQGATFVVSLRLSSVKNEEWERGSKAAGEVGEAISSCFSALTSPVIDTSSPSAPQSLNALEVLIVDDDTDTRDFLATVLGQSGAVVTAVASVQEAMEVLERSQPDVLLSDIGMPDEDGYLLIHKVRSLETQGIKIPAIALTAYASGEERLRTLAAGFQMHLAKPVEPTELVAAVANFAVIPAAHTDLAQVLRNVGDD